MILSTTLNDFFGLFTSNFRAIFLVPPSLRHCVFLILLVITPVSTLIVIELETRQCSRGQEGSRSFLVPRIY